VSANTSHLAHHFESLEQQHHANVLGMWLFLATEVLVFGGLFGAYTVYRLVYPEAWSAGSRALNPWFGGGNTLVLLTSSFTMALGVWCAQTGRSKELTGCLLLTALLGVAFLVSKGFEYHEDYEKRLVPGLNFDAAEWASPRVQLFFLMYYLMTGLHAIHMIVGLGILLALAHYAWRGHYGPEHYAPVEVGGLYWHFVDVIWIFLLPLLYLV
jgi:cytochrome c oxidase subunit 3